jgi:hypothetical protein
MSREEPALRLNQVESMTVAPPVRALDEDEGVLGVLTICLAALFDTWWTTRSPLYFDAVLLPRSMSQEFSAIHAWIVAWCAAFSAEGRWGDILAR